MKSSPTTRKRISKKAVNAARGKRYTAQEKATIIGMVHQINAERGRGGITAASAEFGVSPLTISHWMRDAGVQSTNRRSNVDHAEIFRELADHHKQIAEKQTELSDLETRFSQLKAKL